MKALPIALALLSLAAPAGAGSFTDLVMAPGVFADAPDGEVATYERTLQAPADLSQLTGKSGRVALAARPGQRGRLLAMTRTQDGATLPIAEFPASGANPVLLYFLESTARNMGEATGGSPFYIRNRMREALDAAQAGDPGTVQTVTLQPFAHDPNRARMGIFADLTLTLRYDPADPGRPLELSADTAPGPNGYHDRLVLIAEE